MANQGTDIAEALQKAHRSLLEDLRKLEEGTHMSVGKTELIARLTATRSHIAEHFRFEEQNGYLDSVQKREPRLERTIQELADEHRQLAGSLDSLIERASKGTSPDAGLCEKIRGWIKQVHHHEAKENEVVQDAFNRDLGPED